jgi:flagellar basal-body rod protein FlgF
MDTLSAIAASGMRARMQELDILANNLANTSSRGYKADREVYSLYTSGDASGAPESGSATQPWLKSTWVDFAQGTTASTGNPSDVALVGKGFLAVRGSSGTLYTRNGSLKVTSKGDLVAAEDRAVLDANGNPVKLNPSLPYEIDRGGVVTQAGNTVAQLSVVEFSNPAGLVKAGQAYFQASGSGVVATPAINTEVHQGQLEESNAGPAEGAVRLVDVMRQFEMLQKAITLGAEMDKQAISEVAKVNP